MTDTLIEAKPEIGDEIRQLRQAKGLTLRDLARLSGRSLGYLSQIERDQVRPSLDTLDSIAKALEVEVNWFFPATTGADRGEAGVVVRSQSRRRLSYAYRLDTAALGYEDFLLSASLDLEICMGLSRLSPKGKTNAAPKQYDNHMCGYIVKGSVTLLVDNEVFALSEGDSFSFDCRRPHNIENSGETIAEVVWALSPVKLDF